jgi:type IV pilus assembly protein PilQ
MKKYLLLFLLCWTTKIGALTLNVDHANLASLIRFMAHSAGISVLLSPAINGTVSIAIHDGDPMKALDTLLVTNDLARTQVGSIWYIATRDELVKQKQQEIKWQTVSQQAEPLLTRAYRLRYARAVDIKKMLQGQHASLLSKRGNVQADQRTNTLLIQDIASNESMLKQLVRDLDVPVKQIMIEARLISIDNDYERELGISFANSGPSTQTSGNPLSAMAKSAGRYSIAVARLADGPQLDVRLSALEANGHAELISSPRLFTASQQTASIESGEEVPYQEVSESGGTAVTFKKAVLGLKVTPQILPGSRVLMQLKINQDRPGAKMVQGVPTISTRQMLTSLIAKNGETIVLGGIYELNKENGEQRVPFLADIPLLGALFRTHTDRHNKRELLIFVTPKIMT